MGKKILLADDSITIQKVIELTFSDEDFEVVTVGNGRLAIERVQEVRPDIVLCDIIMPEKDGYEVCEFVKRDPALAHIPVLLLTGAFEPFDQERAARVGCDGFLAKPFEPQTLIAKVKDLLAQAARPAGAPAAPEPSAPQAEPATELRATGPVAPEAEGEIPFFEAAPEPPAPARTSEPENGATVAEEPEPEVQFIADDVAGLEPDTDEGHETFEAYGAKPLTDLTTPEAFTPVDDAGAEPDLLPVTAEEAETLGGAPPWSQPTAEVPLEERAQASVEAQQAPAGESFFEEIFEDEEESTPTAPLPGIEERGATPAPPVESTPPGASRPAEPAPSTQRWTAFESPVAPPPEPPSTPPPAPEPARTAEAPATQASPTPADALEDLEPPATDTSEEHVSFADVRPAEPAPAAPEPSVAGDVRVPVDMVSQIAQRVVAQISEKVIREIAWEVIPDLAETLIKKEIERLKGELQHS